MRRFLWGQNTQWIAVWMLLSFFCACDDHGDKETWKRASWSPDQAGVALIAGEDGTDLLISLQPEFSWRKLAKAREKHQFLHPLWLKDEGGAWLIGIFEIGAISDASGGKDDDPVFRIYRVDDGTSLDSLAESVNTEIMAMEDLLTVQAGLESESLLYAGKIQDHWEIREHLLGLPGARTIVASQATDFNVLIAENLQWIAVLEEGPEAGPVLSIYPIRVAWSGPAARWALDNILYTSEIKAEWTWKLRSGSPDGAWVLLEGRAGGESTLLLCRPMDRLAVDIPLHGRLEKLRWSASSRYLAYQEERAADAGHHTMLMIYDCYSNNTRSIALDSSIEMLGWSPDGDILLGSESDHMKTLTRLDPQLGRRTLLLVAGEEDELLVSTAGRIALYHGQVPGPLPNK
jgi:hypothetical protein